MQTESSFKIDFFGLGAARCRTTWIAQCLDEHPQISIAKIKEPAFLTQKVGPFSTEDNKLFLKNWDWYRSLFDHAEKENITGEFSTDLLPNTASAPALIKRHFPQAKFIVSLRDPVERLYSQYWFEKIRRTRLWDMWYTHKIEVPETFDEALKNPDFIYRSRYYEQLVPWFKMFRRERFFIILDIDFDKNPVSAFQSLFHFLGVDPAFQPPSIFKKVNKIRKGGVLSSFSSWVYKSLRKMNLEGTIQALNSHRLLKVLKPKGRGFTYPPLNPKTAAFLRNMLLPDINNLEKCLDRNLSAWKQ